MADANPRRKSYPKPNPAVSNQPILGSSLMLAALLTLACAASLEPSGDGWVPVPLVTAEMRARGIAGGEGGQWPRAMAVSADGRFLIHALDVSGMFRSLDGGSTWEPANVGFHPRGTCAVAIDPLNPDRVLVAAANSAASAHHGLYLSTDRAASWRHVLAENYAAGHDIRDQIVFGTDSFSPSVGGSALVLWSKVAEDQAGFGETVDDPALYRSLDGGATWKRVPGGERFSGATLRADPERKNTFYALTNEGLFVTSDAGTRWMAVSSGQFTGIDVTPEQPSSIWLSEKDRLLVSSDRGQTWTGLNAPSKPSNWQYAWIKVSPADPDRIFVWAHDPEVIWEAAFWVSHDGGSNWTEVTKDSSDAFLPQNGRQGYWVWHPTDPNDAWSWGGDWPTKSTDGGKTLKWSANGDNQVLVGGKWNFSKADPDLIFFGSQDYNGAITRDAGHTWTYLNPAGLEWGGFCYGGYAATRDVLVVGNAAGWGAPRILRVSRDAGRTWTDTGLEFKGMDASFGLGNVVFASDLRSADLGRTWARMADCHGVLGVSPDKELLFGVRNAEKPAIVTSRDFGVSWQVVAEAPGPINDVAYDHKSDRFYAVVSDRLMAFSGGTWSELPTPKDHFGNVRLRTVAVDPSDPRVVYGGSANHVSTSSVSVIRSLDSGKTWTVLTRQEPLDGKSFDGGREAETIRVHPVTREAYVATSCFGWWKYPAPKDPAR